MSASLPPEAGSWLNGYRDGLAGHPGDRCASGRSCRGDHDGHGALVADGPLCLACLDASRADLRALVLDYADLEQLLVATGTRALFVTGTREPPIPYAVGIDALQHDIWYAVTTWEEIVRDLAGLAEPAVRVRPGWAVQHAVAILEHRLGMLSRVGPVALYLDGRPGEQTGLEAVQGFSSLHKRARAALGLTRHVERLYGRCRACDWETLRRDAGSETVYCAHCGVKQTRDEYHRWLAELASEHAPKRKGRR